MPEVVERELAKLIYDGEITLFRACEERRNLLVRRHDFSTYASFRTLDLLNEGEVNMNNLRSFLRSNGQFPSDEEVIAIIRRLDCDADGKVSYSDLSEAIKPQEFSLMNSYILPPEIGGDQTYYYI